MWILNCVNIARIHLFLFYCSGCVLVISLQIWSGFGSLRVACSVCDFSGYLTRAPIPPRSAAELKSLTGPREMFPALPLPYLSTCDFTNKNTGLLISLSLMPYLSINHLTVLFSALVWFMFISSSLNFPVGARAFQELTGGDFPVWKGAAGFQVGSNNTRWLSSNTAYALLFLVKFGLVHLLSGAVFEKGWAGGGNPVPAACRRATREAVP